MGYLERGLSLFKTVSYTLATLALLVKGSLGPFFVMLLLVKLAGVLSFFKIAPGFYLKAF